MSAAGEVAGHAFLSYAREDKEHVDQLQGTLEAAGIPVWRDIRDLQPGQDWKLGIRRAVSDDALAFLACFSKASQGKPKSYQNEELWLAAEQFRLRPPGRPWLIPVRFDDCAVPDLNLGGGRTLASLQWANLFGETRAGHTTRLIDAILQILGRDPGVTTSAEETLDRRVAVAEAVAALHEAVRLDPRYAYAHRRLGAALLDQGHYTEAEAAEREAIRLDPHNAFAHSRLGEALRLQGRLAEAVTALREAVRLDPRYAYAHSRLGEALRQQSQHAEAVAALHEAVRLDPRYAYAHRRLGAALLDQGHYTEAEAAEREAIRLDPHNAFAHSRLGEALRLQGRLAEAVTALREAVRLDARYAYAHSRLGEALRQQSQDVDGEAHGPMPST